MTPPLVEALRLTNIRVQNLVRRLRHAQQNKIVVSSQDFEDLRGELTLVAMWYREVSPELLPQQEFAKEVADYRKSLEELQQMLPKIYSTLLIERVRIEAKFNRLGAATAWADASRVTM